MLLRHLGYEVKFCRADMNDPDVHVVNLVAVDGREYLVDAGYAAPFLKPLPRDLDEDYVIEWGHDRYVLGPQDKEGCSCLELHRDGEYKHSYTVKPVPRAIEHFSQVIAHSFTDKSTFMNALLLIRFFSDRSVALHNLTLIESEGRSAHVSTLAGRDDIPDAVEQHFLIPRDIVAAAIDGLGEFRDAWN